MKELPEVYNKALDGLCFFEKHINIDKMKWIYMYLIKINNGYYFDEKFFSHVYSLIQIKTRAYCKIFLQKQKLSLTGIENLNASLN